MARTTIHLIRHADALPDIDARIETSDYDALPLSATGVVQAEALAQRIVAGRWRPAAIYASPTRRAYETAAILGGAVGHAVVVDPRLREMHLGDVGSGTAPAGERSGIIRTRLAELAAIAQRDGSWHNVPDAEPAAVVRDRMIAAIEAIAGRHRGRHVAIVSHAGSINAYLAAIVGTPRDFFFLAGNTSLSSVAISEDAVSLIRLNDTAHLESLVRVAQDAATTP